MSRKRSFWTVCGALVVLFLFSVNASAGMFDQFEVNVGKSVHEQLVKSYGEHHPSIQRRMWLDEIFRRLTAQVERTEIMYSLTVLNTEDVNAFAAPGGYLFLTRGMLRVLENDEHQMAAVLGHEIAHVEKKHGLNALLRQMGLTLLMEVSLFYFNAASSEGIRIASTLFVEMVQSGWGRDAEFEADQLGQQYAAQAGFDPVGAVQLMDYLLTLDTPELPMILFRTHPPTSERKDRIMALAANYWESPQPSEVGRNLNLSKRMDPRGRFSLQSVQDDGGKWRLTGIDSQNERQIDWLPEYEVMYPSWSNNGDYLAVMVKPDLYWELWILNRLGNVMHRWRQFGQADTMYPAWGPDDTMISFVFRSGDRWHIRVGYFPYQADVTVTPEYDGEVPEQLGWAESSVVYQLKRDWYEVSAPSLQPVVITNPVPLILQRKAGNLPTVIREGDSFRITVPKLTLP